MQVLLCLANQAGRVVTRDELLSTVWQGSCPNDGVVAKAIYSLRKALGDDARRPSFIETVPKIGYRLIPSIDQPDTGLTERTASGIASASLQDRPVGGWSRHRFVPIWSTRPAPKAAALAALLIAAFGVGVWSIRPTSYETERVLVFKTYDTGGGLETDSLIFRQTTTDPEMAEFPRLRFDRPDSLFRFLSRRLMTAAPHVESRRSETTR